MECCKKDIVIRKAEPEDFKEIILMSQKHADERKIVSNKGKDYVKNGNDGEMEAFKLCDGKMMNCIVAEYNNGSSIKRLVGYAFYVLAFSAAEGKHFKINDFYVESSERHRGVGTCLFDHILKDFLHEKFRKLTFIAARWEISGRKFFEKKGAHNTSIDEVVYYVMPRKCLENLAKHEVTSLQIGEEEISFRMAVPDDCNKIMKLLVDMYVLTNFDDVKISTEQLKYDLFESEPFLYCFVAEKTVKGSCRKEVVGMILYYSFYSMLNEKCLYLESIQIDESYRHKGIGSQLFNHLGKFAVENDCKSMEFMALAWNEPSIKFYDKKGCIDVTKQHNLDLYVIQRKDLLK